MKNPRISIITPVYNGANDINACIRSVANQTYQNKEHLIIDGLSKDNTLDIVQQAAANHSHIKFISEADKGIYDAMNKGIQLATGDYLYFLGVDDLFYTDTILEEIFAQNDLEAIDFIYGKSFYKEANLNYGKEFVLNDFKKQNINHQAIFYAKNIFAKIGNYEIQYKIAADWGFNIRCFLHDAIKRKYVDKTICLFNDTGLSNSISRDLLFQQIHLSLFPTLSFKEQVKLVYYKYKPTWFNPMRWLKQSC